MVIFSILLLLGSAMFLASVITGVLAIINMVSFEIPLLCCAAFSILVVIIFLMALNMDSEETENNSSDDIEELDDW